MTNQGGRASCKLVGPRAVVETCPPRESCDSAGHEPEGERGHMTLHMKVTKRSPDSRVMSCDLS